MIIYIVLCIYGIYSTVDSLLDTWTGKDLGIYFDMLGDKAYYLKPIIFCTLCMSSVWGTLLQYGYMNGNPFFIFVSNIFAIAGVISLIERYLK